MVLGMKSSEDRCTTTKLLQQSIIQLCKVTAGLSGNLVVDGIVCICSDDEPHQIVVKIHERLQLGILDGCDKTIACDSNQKHGQDVFLVEPESQGEESFCYESNQKHDQDVSLVEPGSQWEESLCHESNQKCGRIKDVSLINAESQEKELLLQEEVNSKVDAQSVLECSTRSVKNTLGRDGDDKQYGCGICFVRFGTKEHLVDHELKLHFKPKSHFCHTCQIGFTDGVSYVRHRYSSCHKIRPRLRRATGSYQQRPRNVNPHRDSRSFSGNQQKSDTEDLGSSCKPEATPISSLPNAAADCLSNPNDILPLAAGEYVICVNQPGDKLQDESRIHNSMQHHAATQGEVSEQNDSLCDIVISHERSLASTQRSATSLEVPIPRVTDKPLLVECQDQTTVNTREDGVINLSFKTSQEGCAVEKTDVSTEKQFLCEFCLQNLTTLDKYVCHMEKTHKWYPCHCCPRMYRDVFERRSHTHTEHQLPALYCNICHTDFFNNDMYTKHVHHSHAIGDVQDGTSWYEEENSTSLLDTQSEALLNVLVSDAPHTQSVTSQMADPVGSNKQMNDTMQYQMDSNIKVYDISDDESPITIDDNDRQEHALNQNCGRVKPPQAPPHPDKTYVCAMCSNVLHGVAAFEQHCMSAHSRYGCMYCEKLFTQKGNMRRHQLTHTGEKPYRCIMCGVAFNRKEQLTSHELSSHNIVVRSQFYTLNYKQQTCDPPQRTGS